MSDITQKPIFLLTGFLGSGKTTLLNTLLKQAEFTNTLVIINEFGEVGLDHFLVEASSDTILELSNGCLCCSVRGELVDTLLSLDTNTFDRIIIETTGVADPIPVLQSLTAQSELIKRFKPAGILTVVDSIRGTEILEHYEEAQNQLAIADLIYLSKSNHEDANSIEVTKSIRLTNQYAIILKAPEEIIPTKFDTATNKNLVSQTHKHAHKSRFQSVVLSTEHALDTQTVAGFCHHLANILGSDLLRIKGLVLTKENPENPILVQVSGQIVHDFQKLNKWPESHRKTQLIVITTTAQSNMIQSIFDGFTGNIATDTADKQALTENPLLIPGHGM